MSNLLEGARAGDLDWLIKNKIHLDEYESKMGRPENVITVSFKVKQKEPAQDLVSFLENGYEWVLDADVSTGEIDDGEYLVFLEMRRNPKAVDQIIEMLSDMQHLTNIKPESWNFRWYKNREYAPVNADELKNTVPTTRKDYTSMTENFNRVEESSKDLLPDINTLKRLSGLG